MQLLSWIKIFYQLNFKYLSYEKVTIHFSIPKKPKLSFSVPYFWTYFILKVESFFWDTLYIYDTNIQTCCNQSLVEFCVVIVMDNCVSAFRKCLSDFRTYFLILSK